MNLKVSTKNLDHPATKAGIVYVLEIDVDGKRVIKIGVTGRKIEDRCSEILVSYFKSYREFPYLRPKRFRKTADMFAREKELLTYFSDRKYTSEKKFGGCQELVDVPVEEVVEKYEEVMSNAEVPKKKRCKRKPAEKSDGVGE